MNTECVPVPNPLQNKTIASFDVGIKHLAYCVFRTTTPITILDWNIVDLTKQQESPRRLCECNKSIKTRERCNKKGAFIKNGVVHCSVHAKKHEDFAFNEKRFSVPSLKKMKLPELVVACNTYGVSIADATDANTPNTKTAKRPVLLERFMSFIKDRSFEAIRQDNPHSADMNMISVGRNMKKRLNDIQSMLGVDVVLIENQISPIAKRMKDVQVLLTQYFIMKSDETVIIYVSSSNKLKLFSQFVPENSVVADTSVEPQSSSSSSSSSSLENKNTKEKVDPAERTKNQIYNMHKKDAVIHTKNIICKNGSLAKWTNQLESSKKKDDYADCFLQGLWYLHNTGVVKIHSYIIS
jgi:hypothetical protein